MASELWVVSHNCPFVDHIDRVNWFIIHQPGFYEKLEPTIDAKQSPTMPPEQAKQIFRRYLAAENGRKKLVQSLREPIRLWMNWYRIPHDQYNESVFWEFRRGHEAMPDTGRRSRFTDREEA